MNPGSPAWEAGVLVQARRPPRPWIGGVFWEGWINFMVWGGEWQAWPPVMLRGSLEW